MSNYMGEKMSKNRYMDAPILITPKWDLEFHIHIDASNFVVGATLA